MERSHSFTFIFIQITQLSSALKLFRFLVLVLASRLHPHDEIVAAVLSEVLVRIAGGGHCSHTLEDKHILVQTSKQLRCTRMDKFPLCKLSHLVEIISVPELSTGNGFCDALSFAGAEAAARPTELFQHLVAFVALVDEFCCSFRDGAHETGRCDRLSSVVSGISVETAEGSGRR